MPCSHPSESFFLDRRTHRARSCPCRASSDIAELYDELMGQLRAMWLRPCPAFKGDFILGMLLSRYRGVPESPADAEETKFHVSAALRRLLCTSLLSVAVAIPCDRYVRLLLG